MKRLAASLFVLVLLVPGCRGGDEAEVPAADTVSAVAEPLVTNTAPVLAQTATGMTIIVVLEDNVIGMPTDDIPPGPVVFTVSNAGTEIHSFAVEGPGVEARLGRNLETNEDATMEAVFQPGTYLAWCPMHEANEGERIQFEVEPSA